MAATDRRLEEWNVSEEEAVVDRTLPRFHDAGYWIVFGVRDDRPADAKWLALAVGKSESPTAFVTNLVAHGPTKRVALETLEKQCFE
jgi:hypothetical protein